MGHPYNLQPDSVNELYLPSEVCPLKWLMLFAIFKTPGHSMDLEKFEDFNKTVSQQHVDNDDVSFHFVYKQ